MLEYDDDFSGIGSVGIDCIGDLGTEICSSEILILFTTVVVCVTSVKEVRYNRYI